jgi:cytochrome c peroxidase
MQRVLLAIGVVAAVVACSDAPTDVSDDPATTPLLKKGGNKPGNGGAGATEAQIALGKWAFEAQELSVNGNQSCQSCHHPDQGFAAAPPGTVTRGSVVQGSVAGQFGDRKPPSAAYASGIPNFSFSGNNAVGGHFWDGRATGELLGTAAADQAIGPFLNPKEQALPDEACVVWHVQELYATEYNAAWPDDDIVTIGLPPGIETTCTTVGASAIPDGELDRARVKAAYYNIARSIAAFESTFNVFDSRFDRGQLTAFEEQGAQLFGGKGKCQQCHDNKGDKPLFTDFEFHNLGVPTNPDNPVHNYATGTFDPGLGGVTGNTKHIGKFKTPTVRNVAEGGDNRTYMHNGALVDLRQVVQFYNTRDVLPECTDAVVLDDPASWGPDGAGCWPRAEHPDNLDTRNMGNLGLTSDEVDAIVAYMKAMTDLR